MLDIAFDTTAHKHPRSRTDTDCTILTRAMPSTMKAVVFQGPRHIALEDRPIPQIEEPTDAIIKVLLTALCGRCVLLVRGSFVRPR